MVTGIVTDELLATLIRLHQVGRRVALVSLEEKEPNSSSLPPGIQIYHLPASELPFDETLMGDPEQWEHDLAPEYAPPIRFAGPAR